MKKGPIFFHLYRNNTTKMETTRIDRRPTHSMDETAFEPMERRCDACGSSCMIISLKEWITIDDQSSPSSYFSRQSIYESNDGIGYVLEDQVNRIVLCDYPEWGFAKFHTFCETCAKLYIRPGECVWCTEAHWNDDSRKEDESEHNAWRVSWPPSTDEWKQMIETEMSNESSTTTTTTVSNQNNNDEEEEYVFCRLS